MIGRRMSRESDYVKIVLLHISQGLFLHRPHLEIGGCLALHPLRNGRLLECAASHEWDGMLTCELGKGMPPIWIPEAQKLPYQLRFLIRLRLSTRKLSNKLFRIN